LDEMRTRTMKIKRKTPYNSTYTQVAVQWLIQALCSYQSLCLVDSFVLQNRHLRVAAKRYGQVYETTPKRTNKRTTLNVLDINNMGDQ